MKISGVVITFNEEAKIERCLKSMLSICDELLVVDSQSTDKTCEIAQSLGARVLQHPFAGHVEQKTWAAEQAKYDWVLSLDADEAASSELVGEITSIKSQGTLQDAFEGPRITQFCGHWIKRSGWYPDTRIRLFNRKATTWTGTNPHDFIAPPNKIGQLSGDILHYSYDNLGEHVRQANSFSTIAANAAYKKGRRANFIIDIILNPFFTFLKKYILQLGFLEGRVGFLVCIMSSYSSFLKYSKLYFVERGQ